MRETHFSQGALIKPFKQQGGTLTTGGICFRVTWKWAACKAADAPFRYMKLNVEKTANKHMVYREPTLTLAKTTDFSKPDQALHYIATDRDAHVHNMNLWGGCFKDANKGAHTGAKPGNLIEQTLDKYVGEHGPANVGALVYVFYWTGKDKSTQNDTVLGHAVAHRLHISIPISLKSRLIPATKSSKPLRIVLENTHRRRSAHPCT